MPQPSGKPPILETRQSAWTRLAPKRARLGADTMMCRISIRSTRLARWLRFSMRRMEERSARQAYIDARPLGDVSPALLRRGELYPRKGLPPGILSPLPFEKAPAAKIEGSARVGVDLRIDLADGFVLRETRKESSAAGDVGVSMPP
jgi:hypothetical protein